MGGPRGGRGSEPVVRLFIGVQLSPALRALVARETGPLRSAIPDVRWTDEDALHITLRFLGEVAEDDVASVGSALEACASAQRPFTLSTTGLGAFPRMGRAQVVWLGVEDGGATGGIVNCLDAALAPLGFLPEQRAFTPHVTLGRARNRNGVRVSDRERAMQLAVGSMQVDRIALIRSHLGRGPARHEVLRAAMLGGGTE